MQSGASRTAALVSDQLLRGGRSDRTAKRCSLLFTSWAKNFLTRKSQFGSSLLIHSIVEAVSVRFGFLAELAVKTRTSFFSKIIVTPSIPPNAGQRIRRVT